MKNLTLDIHIPKTEFINLQTDFGFKRIFGSEKRKSILIRFLNALFEGEFIIEDAIYKDKEQLLPIDDRKRIVYDVFCESTIDGRKHLEMMDKNSKAYKSGEFDDLFEASERVVMEPAEAIAYVESYLRMKNFRHNLELVRAESIEKGFEKGRKEGMHEEKLAVAQKMLELGSEIDLICNVTGLTKEEIEAMTGI